MHPLAEILGANTLVALIPAGAAVVAYVCRRQALAHVLWIVVLVKLVTPPLWHVPVLPAESSPQVVHAMPAPVPYLPPESHAPALKVDVGVAATTEPPLSEAPAKSAAPQSAAPRETPAIAPEQWLIVCWAAGSVIIMAITWRRIRRFRAALRETSPAPAWLRAEVESLGHQLALRGLPEVRTTTMSLAPMIWFMGFRPILLVSAKVLEELSSAQRAAVLTHELAHLKRGDHWIRWLELLITTAMWWHPLVWIARHGLRAAEEEACDAWATWQAHDPHTYASALVDSLQKTIAKPLPACASGLGRLGNIKRRLHMIMNATPGKAPSRRVWAMVLAGVLLIPFLPGRGSGAATPLPESPQVANQPDATADAVRALLELAIKKGTPEEDSMAAAALSSLQQFGVKAVPALVGSLKEAQFHDISLSVLMELRYDSIDALLAAMASDDARIRAAVAQSLTMIVGQSRSSTSPWSPGAAAPGPDGAFVDPQKWSAFLQKLTPPSEKLLADADSTVREKAVALWGTLHLGSTEDAALQPLINALKDNDVLVRRSACIALLQFRENASKAVPALIPLLEEKDVEMRRTVIDTLQEIGPGAKEATSVLVKALKDPDADVRGRAVIALGAINREPGQASSPFAPGGFPDFPGAPGMRFDPNSGTIQNTPTPGLLR